MGKVKAFLKEVLEILVVACVTLIIVLTVEQAVTPDQFVSLSEETVFFASECSSGCLSIQEWREEGTTSDDRLLAGLVIAYQYHSDWRPIARKATMLGIHIRWGDTEDKLGWYHPFSNTITIHSDLQSEPLSILAAVLTHEVTHAYQDAVNSNLFWPWGDRCIAREVHAGSWEALTWSHAKTGLETSYLAVYLDGKLQSLQEGTLSENVAQNPSRQKQCYWFFR